MKIVFVAGISGAGKTTCLNTLEDLGYYTASSIPVSVLQKLIEVVYKDEGMNRLAFSLNTRAGFDLPLFIRLLHELKDNRYNYEIIFVDASDSALLERYALSRRRHPFEVSGSLLGAIDEERVNLVSLREIATFTIDTTFLTVKDLKETIREYFLKEGEYPFEVSIISFGFKYGIPQDADMVLDVRFLANPYYESDLSNLNGTDSRVQNYIEKGSSTGEFLSNTLNYLKFLLPNYQKEGKAIFHLAVGCSGGMHRAVYIGEKIKAELKQLNYPVRLYHRDINRKSV